MSESGMLAAARGFRARGQDAPADESPAYGFPTRSWLNGKSIPKQDEIRVLAAIVGMEPHELQFGGKARAGEGKAQWAEALDPQERAMVDAFLNLPAPQRRLVRELIMAFSAQRVGSKGA